LLDHLVSAQQRLGIVRPSAPVASATLALTLSAWKVGLLVLAVGAIGFVALRSNTN
jgi:hypothetical protein